MARKDDVALKDELITAMLVHVPFDGWGSTARDSAAQDLDMTPEQGAQIIADAAAAIDAFTDLADRQMAKSLDGLNPRPMKITAIIRQAILCRLDNAEPHRQAVAETLKILARPQYAPLAAKTLYRTIDRIWRLTGDQAVDFSFYTKRATLTGVYSAVLLYWLANPNADRAKIERFIDQRLKEVAFIPVIIAPAKKTAQIGLNIASKLMGLMPNRQPAD